MRYEVSSGEISSGIILSSYYDSMFISSGGTANSTTINDWGPMRIDSGGTATDIIENGGYVYIEDGAYATFASNTIEVFVLSNANMTVHKNTIANSTTINSGGSMYISSGGVANSTTINGGGMDIYSGGTANSTIIIYGGSMYISSGGTANSTTINYGGSMYISSGGTTNSMTINSGGYMGIDSGGTATEIIENGGYVDVAYGAYATFASNTIEGFVLSYDSMTVHKNTIANSTTINTGGAMYISSGGTANSTTILFCGYMRIDSGGTANSTIINPHGDMLIYSGGTATEIVENGGYVYIADGAYATFASNTIEGFVLSNFTSMTVHKNTIANSTTINGGGAMYISSGGTANSTTINSDGYMDISSGGTATNITANTNAGIGITVASNTHIQGIYNGSAFEMKEAFISGYTIHYDCNMNISSGGTANNTTISGGRLYISSGGTANSTTISGGDMRIVSGGIANSTIINPHGDILIYSGGTANSTTVNSGGHLYISSGGVANSTTINYGGNMRISSGGTANSTTIHYGGDMLIYSGGVANSTIINPHGDMLIYSGGTANSTTINGGGDMYISSGGTAANIIENGGYVYIEKGAYATFASNTIEGVVLSYTSMTVHKNTIANNTTINNGYMYIYSGGVANNTTIKSYGDMYIFSGGIHRGNLQIESGAVVLAFSGGIIDFTVADRKESDGYLINNLSLITGTPTYTITVSEDQAAGTYKLAQGASALNGTISICTEDTCFGSLTVNGDVLTVDGVTYDLNNVDGDLTLTITTSKSEYIVGNFNGMFELTPDGNGIIYTPSGKQEIAGTVDPESWELVGAGDFNKSGTDGLLWVEKETGYVYVQNDLTNFVEVKNKSNCLGVLAEGYNILGTGDFTGTGIRGVLMQGPAFGDESISLNYGLPIWGREADGITFAGWLGALVNTWQPGDALKGDTSDLADINARNYMYEVVSVGDYNGDGVDDVMLQNIMPKTVDGVTITGSGDVFTFLTGDMDAVKAGASPTVAYAGCATDGWKIVGTGDFDSDGIDDVLLSDGTGVAGCKMVNGQRSADLWFGNLGETEEISGITDLNNDGTDDILILNTATDTYSGWLVKDGVITGSITLA